MITGAMIGPPPMDPVPPQVRVAMEIEAGLRASLLHLAHAGCAEGEGWKNRELKGSLDKDVNATRKAALEVIRLYLSGEHGFQHAPQPRLGENTSDDTWDGQAPQPVKV